MKLKEFLTKFEFHSVTAETFLFWLKSNKKSTTWETQPRMTPQKTSRLLMGLEQVMRPKTLQAT
jgi:hypothetical protein